MSLSPMVTSPFWFQLQLYYCSLGKIVIFANNTIRFSEGHRNFANNTIRFQAHFTTLLWTFWNSFYFEHFLWWWNWFGIEFKKCELLVVNLLTWFRRELGIREKNYCGEFGPISGLISMLLSQFWTRSELSIGRGPIEFLTWQHKLQAIIKIFVKTHIFIFVISLFWKAREWTCNK